MLFGLINALAVFMDLTNKVFRQFLDQFAIVFIDDILLYSRNKEQYEEQLKILLEIIKNKKLYVKFKKCEFLLDRIGFMGYVYSARD